MKKTLLSATAFAVVAVAAVAAAPTTSEAIPAFARQTGAACLSCHFQTFPQLASFGRAFKRGAFTDVGEQALVEDDGLSIPASLNASLVLRASYQNVKSTTAPATATGPGFQNGSWSLPIEAPLLIAGRVGSNIGAFGEFGGGASGANGSPVANWQVMSSFDFGNFRAGLNAFNTGFGFTAGIETSNVAGQHSGALGGMGDAVSAAMQLGFRGGNTEGLALWGGNDLWTAQVGLVAPDTNMMGLGAPNIGLKLAPEVRVFVTPDVAGWDTGIGFGIVSGTVGAASTNAASGIPVGLKAAGMNMWYIDAQAQGEVGDASVGIYADYASTKNKSNTAVNIYGVGADAAGVAGGAANDKADGFSIRATVEPIHGVILGAGYGQTKFKPAVGLSGKRKVFHVAATYEIYQNAELTLAYTNDKMDAAYNAAAAGGVAANTTKTTLLTFEALM